MNPELTKYFPFLMGFAPLLLFWQQGKSFVVGIFRIFWKKRIIPRHHKKEFILSLRNDSWVYDFDNYKSSSMIAYSKSNNKFVAPVFKIVSLELYLYKYFIPIFLSGSPEGATINYFKFTFDFESYIGKISKDMSKCNYSLTDSFYVSVIRGKSKKITRGDTASRSWDVPDSLKEAKSDQPLYRHEDIVNWNLPYIISYPTSDLCVFKPINLKHKYIFTQKGRNLLEMAQKWLKAEAWYQEKGIRHYRGIVLTGKPGSGKSALITEIAKTLNIPIFIYDLSSMDNQEFVESFGSQTYSPAIVLFEDIDAVWNGRENVTKNSMDSGLTFDCFINQLSGVNAIKNKLVFVTTNHAEKLDPALIRPGRIDEHIELDSLNKDEKTQMADVIFDNNTQLVQSIVNDGINDSTAEFENRCVQKALDIYWKNPEKP